MQLSNVNRDGKNFWEWSRLGEPNFLELGLNLVININKIEIEIFIS